MLVKVVRRDDGDYFEIHQNVEGATLKYFARDSVDNTPELSMNFNNVEEAETAVESFDEIKDLI